MRLQRTIEWDPVEVASPTTRSFNMYRGALSELTDDDGEVWLAYLILGTIFLIGGMVAWNKKGD